MTQQTPRVVVGVSAALAPSYADRAQRLLPALATGLRERYPAAEWDVRLVADTQARSSAAGPSVSSLMTRGRRLLLAGDLDVALVLSDREPTLRGRPVAAHVSPVQQTAVMFVADPDAPVVEEALGLVADAVGLDGSPEEDAPRLLAQLASSVPRDVRGAHFVRRAVGDNLGLLVALVRANRPWLMTLHLSRTLTGAFAASFLAVVTPDFWLLADRMGPVRLTVITLLVLAVLCGVLVIGHALGLAGLSLLRRLVELLQKVLRLHGLDQMQLEAGLSRAALVLLAAIRGHGDQSRLRRGGVGPQRGGELVAVGVGQADVAEHDVRTRPLRGFEPLAAAIGERDLVSAQLEELAQALRRIVVVFHHQDAQVLARLERGKLGFGRRPALQLLQAPAEVAERVENLELQRVDAAQRSGFHAHVAIGIEKKPCHVLDAADHHSGVEVVHGPHGTRAQAADVLERARVVAATGGRHHRVHQRRVKVKSFVELTFWHVMHCPAIR